MKRFNRKAAHVLNPTPIPPSPEAIRTYKRAMHAVRDHAGCGGQTTLRACPYRKAHWKAAENRYPA